MIPAGPTQEPALPASFARLLALIVLLDALVVLPFLGARTLWNIDEGRISEMAREMAANGNWIVPTIGDHPYASYPPLAYWLMAPCGMIFGFNEFSMRLPSALAGLALIAVVGCLGRRLAGDRAGIAAAMVLASTSGFFTQQATARADVILTLFATVAFDRFLAVAEGDRRARNLVVMYAAIALGILTKGPLAAVIPGVGVAAWLALKRQWRVLLDVKPWFGLPGVLALTVPWYIAVHHALGPNGWEFLRINLLKENLSAAVDGNEHPKPLWFYFSMAPQRTIPWVALLPLAWIVRRARGLSTSLAWLAAVFLFLTIAGAKRPNYTTYLMPPFALSTGIALSALWTDAPRRVQQVLTGLAAIVAVGAGVAAFAPIRWTGEFPTIAPLFKLLFVAVAAGAAALIFAAWKKGPAAASAVLALLVGAGFVLHLAVFDPTLDHEGRAGVEFCHRVAAEVPPGEPIGVVNPDSARTALYREDDLEGAYFFYIRRNMPRRCGESGYYLGTAAQRDKLIAPGRGIVTIDSVLDDRRRLKLLFRVTP